MNLPLHERLSLSLTTCGISPGERLVVGFSGGRDSVALVHLLKEGGWPDLVLCHLDHGLRTGSAEDCTWAQEFASGMGLGFLSRRVDVAAAASAAGVGVEEAGREARYAFFCEVSRSHQGAPLVLAHHADDQVETFCFRLLRGAGTSGLGGMAPFSFREDGRVRVLRPLLSVWRWEIDAMVQDRGLAYREDPSNRDSRWTRNRIRHELLPEMERVMQRPVREAIWRAAEILRAEAEWMDTCEGGETVLGEVLDVDALGKMPLALRRRRVARWLRRQGCQGIGFSEVEAVLGLLVRLRPAKVNLSAGCFVRRRQGQIFVEKPGSQRDCD